MKAHQWQVPADLDLHSPLYRCLYQLVHAEALGQVLEIGSADGTGSTRVLARALSPQQGQLYCLEAEPQQFAKVKALYQSQPGVHVYPWLAKYPLQMPSEAEVLQFWREQPSRLRQYPQDLVLQWLSGEQQLINTYAQGVSGVQALKQQLGIQYFDLVLLDGGEFSGPQDLDEVYGATYLVLDDVLTYKNWANYQRLKQDPQYYLISEDLNWQHGCAAFKRRPRQKLGVGAVVHTYNAAEHLAECLRSLSWVEQIWVVDMYSTDQTRAIAEAHRARVVPHLPVLCVDEARNFGLGLVEQEWTLVLDADERIPERLMQEIRAVLQRLEQTGAYWLPRNNHFFGASVPLLFPDYQLRLFRSQAVSWSGRVHEHPSSVVPTAYFPPQLELSITHHSYPDVQQFVQRQLKYAEISWLQTRRKSDYQVPAHEVRQHYDQQMAQVLKQVQLHPGSTQEWAVRQLYLFSELANALVYLQNSQQLNPASQLPAAGKPRLSVYAYLKNGIQFDYPFCESLRAVAPVADEIIVFVAEECQDGTLEALQALQQDLPQLKLKSSQLWQQQGVLQGEIIRMAAEEAMAACQGDWLWHVQSDEVYRDADVQKVAELVQTYHSQPVDAFRFQVLHFYGDYQHLISPQAAEIGWYQSCIRLARRGTAQHYQDAWTLVLHKPDAQVIPTSVQIFHYGHVREQEAMRLKSSYMERLYHDLPPDFEVCAQGEFQYDRVPAEYLQAFESPHPEAMALRIADFQLAQQLQRYRMNGQKPRLLVISRYPGVKKGYGITFNELYATGHLQAHFEVHHLAWHYHQAPQLEQGVQIYPDDRVQFRNPARLRELLYQLAPDVILLHADPHFFIEYREELAAWQGPVVGWFTIDYERVNNPQALTGVFQRCQRVLGMADFGLQQIKKSYQGPTAKVPLGVNTQIFQPVSPERKLELRQQLGLPEKGFIFLTVANNFWRKGIEYTVQTFARFRERYPQYADSYLYLHTESTPVLIDQIQSTGLSRWVLLSHQFDPYKQPLDVTTLAQLYQSADAFLLTTLGEGFGMTLLEAQAVGLPVIVSDNSVIPEVVGPESLLIPCPGWVTGLNAERLVWMRAPDPDEGAQLMARLRTSQALQQHLRETGIRRSLPQNWSKTARLLASQLALALKTGKLEYLPPEPELFKL